MQFSIEIDQSQIDAAKKLLAGVPKGAPRAVSAAVNRTLSHGRTLVKRKVMERLNITQKATLRAIAIKRATPDRLSGSINISRHEIPMGEYHPHQTADGVVVQVRKDRGSQLIHGAFIATMPSGHTGVWKRTGPKRPAPSGRYAGKMRQHIYELYGPTIIGVITDQFVDSIRGEMNSTLAKNVDYQIERLMQSL